MSLSFESCDWSQTTHKKNVTCTLYFVILLFCFVFVIVVCLIEKGAGLSIASCKRFIRSQDYFLNYLMSDSFDGNDLSSWFSTGDNDLNSRIDSMSLSISNLDTIISSMMI